MINDKAIDEYKKQVKLVVYKNDIHVGKILSIPMTIYVMLQKFIELKKKRHHGDMVVKFKDGDPMYIDVTKGEKVSNMIKGIRV